MAQQLNDIIDGLYGEMVDALAGLVQIPSVKADPLPGMPFGKPCYEALEYTLNLCESAGLKTQNFDGYAGHADAFDGEETVGVLTHLDVVPVGDGWDYPPFGAQIDNGKMYGRGVLDNKLSAICSIFAVKALLQMDAKLSKKIRLIFGCDEESGVWECMKYYKTKQKMPDMAFVPDAYFPVINSERGIMQFAIRFPIKAEGITNLQSGTAANVVPGYASCQADSAAGLEKAVASFNERYQADIRISEQNGSWKIESYGVASHGSRPKDGKNALMLLIQFLFENKLAHGKTQELIDALAQNMGLDSSGALLGIAFKDTQSGELTFSPGVFITDETGMEIRCDIRHPVCTNRDQLCSIINQHFENFEHTLTILSAQDPLYVPEDSPLIQTLLRVYEEQTGLKGYTIQMGGGTYARALKNAVAFGPILMGEPVAGPNHGKNECVTLSLLQKNTKIYAHALLELAK